MKRWLRYTLLVMTIGGGFTGIAMTIQMFFSPPDPSLGPIALMAIMALCTFTVISGLLFAEDPHRTFPLKVALALQIPGFSCPLAMYSFSAGLRFSVAIVANQISCGYRLGFDGALGALQQDRPVGISVNLFAAIVLGLLIRAPRTPAAAPALPATANAPAAPDAGAAEAPSAESPSN